MGESHESHRGAYGMCLRSTAVRNGLAEAAAGWRDVEIVHHRGSLDAPVNAIDPHQASFALGHGGGLTVEAAEGRATFTTPTPLSDAELLHPYLAPVGAAFAWWANHESLHAGAVVLDGRAWAVVGDKGQGKSTTLAWLALNGGAVLTDDMLVTDGHRAFAGPRCVDLRPSAASRLGVGQRVLRRPVRWRVALGPVAPEVPLAGWIFLSWGRTLEAVRVPPAALLPRLARNRSMSVPLPDASILLDLATLPAWELRRPRSWDALPQVVERLAALAANG